jgi:hypothetical protein
VREASREERFFVVELMAILPARLKVHATLRQNAGPVEAKKFGT